MSFLASAWRLVRVPLVAAKVRKLRAEGLLQKAPNIALLTVDTGQVSEFKASMSHLSATFDLTVVAWRAPDSVPEASSNFKIISYPGKDFDRWDLIDRRLNGFIFPVKLSALPNRDQLNHLRSHLFSSGGFNAVTSVANELPREKSSSIACTLLPTPVLEVNQTVFDQRFWRIEPGEISGENEFASFALAARTRNFAQLTCSHNSSDISEPLRDFSAQSERESLLRELILAPELLRGNKDKATRTLAHFWSQAEVPPLTNLDSQLPIGLKSVIRGNAESEVSNKDLHARVKRLAGLK